MKRSALLLPTALLTLLALTQAMCNSQETWPKPLNRDQ